MNPILDENFQPPRSAITQDQPNEALQQATASLERIIIQKAQLHAENSQLRVLNASLQAHRPKQDKRDAKLLGTESLIGLSIEP